MKIPNNVIWFEVLMYLSLTLDALSVAFQDRSSVSGDLLGPMILDGGLILLLTYFVHLAARKRRNWPRWILAALLVLSVFSCCRRLPKTVSNSTAASRSCPVF